MKPARAGLRRLRSGELLALLGAALIVVSLLEPWYESALGKLGAFDVFGGTVILLMACACAGLALAVSALAERSTALPVAVGVWTTVLGCIGVIAAAVGVAHRPDHATGALAGPWIALAGAIAVLLGAWQALRDERPSLYEAARPKPRPRP